MKFKIGDKVKVNSNNLCEIGLNWLNINSDKNTIFNIIQRDKTELPYQINTSKLKNIRYDYWVREKDLIRIPNFKDKVKFVKELL